MERRNREYWFGEERAAILSGEAREGSLEGAIWTRLEGGEKEAIWGKSVKIQTLCQKVKKKTNS